MFSDQDSLPFQRISFIRYYFWWVLGKQIPGLDQVGNGLREQIVSSSLELP